MHARRAVTAQSPEEREPDSELVEQRLAGLG
jgi:hypothetical protein